MNEFKIRDDGYREVALEGFYEVNEIDELEEVNIEEWKKELLAENELGIGLKNYNDPSKCKIVATLVARNKRQRWIVKFENDEDFITI